MNYSEKSKGFQNKNLSIGLSLRELLRDGSSNNLMPSGRLKNP